MTAPLRDVPQEGIELIKSFEGIPDGDPTSVNLDAYLDQLREGRESGLGRLSELSRSHPYLPKRIEALRLFANT